MRSYCLTRMERQYMQGLLNEAVTSVQLRDLKECVAFVRNALVSRKETTVKLRQVVRDRMNQTALKFYKKCSRDMRDIRNYHAHFGGTP